MSVCLCVSVFGCVCVLLFCVCVCVCVRLCTFVCLLFECSCVYVLGCVCAVSVCVVCCVFVCSCVSVCLFCVCLCVKCDCGGQNRIKKHAKSIQMRHKFVKVESRSVLGACLRASCAQIANHRSSYSPFGVGLCSGRFGISCSPLNLMLGSLVPQPSGYHWACLSAYG